MQQLKLVQKTTIYFLHHNYSLFKKTYLFSLTSSFNCANGINNEADYHPK